MIDTGRQNPRSRMGWTRYSNDTTTNRGYTYTNTSSKGQDQHKRSAKTTSIALYFFLAALLTCGILIITR